MYVNEVEWHETDSLAGLGPKDRKFVSQTDDAGATSVGAQAKVILGQIDALLAEAGTSKQNLLSASIWLKDIGTFAEMNEVWDKWVVPGAPPARATVEARLAGPQYLIEIAVIAAIG